MTASTIARNASLADVAAILKAQQPRKVDVVLSADKARMIEGTLYISGAEPLIEEDGVTDPNGVYNPTMVFDEGVADKLKIPVQFLRRLRYNRVKLYDAVVNGLLSGNIAPVGFDGPAFDVGEPDDRLFLFRLFRAEGSTEGVARALLSNQYKTIDYLDAITAALKGVELAGVNIQVLSADLTDRRMCVRVYAPEVAVYAQEMLHGYRSPFTGKTAEELPRVFAGFEVSDSEVGEGKYSITPRAVFEVCTNGLKITKDAVSAVHLGGRLDEGVIKWSPDTVRQEIELIVSKAADAVRTFLDVDYMTKVVHDLTEKAGKDVDAATIIPKVGRKLAFSQETIDGVLAAFIRGGQTTAGGVMQAVTAYAQTVPDADLAFSLEDKALEALELACR